MKDSNNSPVNEAQQLEQLRLLILGEDNQRIRDVIKEDARETVSNVLTEALHDRQSTDGTVSQILAPLVDKTVEQSVSNRKEQFVGYLYPLVGSLVRKSVGSFVAGLMEQTNQLIESSLTIKGLQWRIKAWQSGIPYSQYVISQTFLFRVEQVLLIHNETSMLLNTVIRDKTQATDGDMVSAMLTAINDFVSDSFSPDNNSNTQNLDEIKTDDFTLLIKQGPQAMLVAAITGNVPSSIGDQLQLSLENIHKVYGNELQNFNGDALPFENTEQQLNECLLSQQKETQEKRKKTPWFAIIALFSIISLVGFFTVKQYQLELEVLQLQQKIGDMPGIVLLNTEICDEGICIEILRDPIVKQSTTWQTMLASSKKTILVNEQAYRSLDSRLIHHRLEQLATGFPELTYDKKSTSYNGQLTKDQFTQLRTLLYALPDDVDPNKVLSKITINKPTISITKDKLNHILIEQKIASIEKAHFVFNSNESAVTTSAEASLTTLSEEILATVALANKLQYKIKIVIIGVSDQNGNALYNKQLSIKRAESIKSELVKNGVDPYVLQPLGLGALDTNADTRRVLFSVVKVSPNTHNLESNLKVQE